MYSMVLMAALTTAVDMPDRGRRGGGCCGCYGGMAWGGCYGGRGGCYGMGYGGGYGMGYGMGYGGCMGYGGGYGMGYGGWGGWGYGGYVLGTTTPVLSGYAYTPMFSNVVAPVITGGETIVYPGRTQSFYPRSGVVSNLGANSGVASNSGNEATIVVHVPQDATLTIDGQPTQSLAPTRIFHSPPLEPGKTYTYTLRAEMNRDGRFVDVKKSVEVRAGHRTEVTMDNSSADRGATSEEESSDQATPTRTQRIPPIDKAPPPRDR